jgi:hypothetical protein
MMQAIRAIRNICVYRREPLRFVGLKPDSRGWLHHKGLSEARKRKRRTKASGVSSIRLKSW